jgi:DNA-binding transcriptional ArsR family regulator
MVSAADAENRIFQALADPSRRAIFESLARWEGRGACDGEGRRGRRSGRGRRGRRGQRGEAAVKDLTARFNISQPAVSQHLAALKDAGLVNGRREGRCVYYRVEPRGMKPLIDWIAHYRAFWTEHINRLELLLETMDE